MSTILNLFANYSNFLSTYLQVKSNDDFQDINQAIDTDGFNEFIHRILYNHLIEDSKDIRMKFINNPENQKILEGKDVGMKEAVYIGKYLYTLLKESNQKNPNHLPMMFQLDETMTLPIGMILYTGAKINSYSNADDLLKKVLKHMTKVISKNINSLFSKLSSPDIDGKLASTVIDYIKNGLEKINQTYNLTHFLDNNSDSDSDDDTPPNKKRKRTNDNNNDNRINKKPKK